MNYHEVGLAHVEMIPQKRYFVPKRFIPMAPLGRRYKGLEDLPKREVEAMVDRLSRPKTPVPSANTVETEPNIMPHPKSAPPYRSRYYGNIEKPVNDPNFVPYYPVLNKVRITQFEKPDLPDKHYHKPKTKSRFIGKKRMSSLDISNMVDRLTRPKTPDPRKELSDENNYSQKNAAGRGVTRGLS